MRRLTDRAYWDEKYNGDSTAGVSELQRPGLVKRLLGPRAVEYARNYPDYVLWDVIYPDNLPRQASKRVLEVGSAPGDHLVQLWKQFGYEPWGVEYSQQG